MREALQFHDHSSWHTWSSWVVLKRLSLCLCEIHSPFSAIVQREDQMLSSRQREGGWGYQCCLYNWSSQVGAQMLGLHYVGLYEMGPPICTAPMMVLRQSHFQAALCIDCTRAQSQDLISLYTGSDACELRKSDNQAFIFKCLISLRVLCNPNDQTFWSEPVVKIFFLCNRGNFISIQRFRFNLQRCMTILWSRMWCCFLGLCFCAWTNGIW